MLIVWEEAQNTPNAANDPLKNAALQAVVNEGQRPDRAAPALGARLLAKVRNPLSLLHAIWWRLRYYANPGRSPLSPLVRLSYRREQNYYRRSLSDITLAREWGAHYLEGIELAPGARILDHGCGKGRHVALLNQLGYSVYAQDIAANPWWVNLPGVGFQVVPPTAWRLPWADASFDLVLNAQVTHHLSPLALHAHAREVFRVLRPGGHWLVMDANATSLMALNFLRYYGRLHSLPDFLEIAGSAGFVQQRLSFEGFYAPVFPHLVNILRKALGPWPFDLADHSSWLAQCLPAPLRGQWVLDLKKSPAKDTRGLH